LKYDYCSFWGDFSAQVAAYQKMHEALEKTGRPIVFSLCQYGMDGCPSSWKGISPVGRFRG
jgi:alpha-galactosidase